MATSVKDLVISVRDNLLETTPRFWSNDEIIRRLTEGAKDLWGFIIDMKQEHFLIIDATNVTLAANGTTLTGVPTDCFRVVSVEPRDLTITGGSRGVKFTPKPYTHADFVLARSMSAVDATGFGEIFYDIRGAGPSVGAVTIEVAPSITSAMNIRLVYVPIVTPLTPESTNPIPGESDRALTAYATAFCRAKEREDRSPDPNWLAVYATERDHMVVRMEPRQEQEERVVEDFFYGSY